MAELEYLERLTRADAKPQAVIIWLHGLGADYNDFLPIATELRLNKCVKFIFPNAQLRPITINNGYVMRGWYDIFELSALSLDAKVDTDGIKQSQQEIISLINKQLALGFKSEEIILGGFSQGGVMSYITGLTFNQSLGGIISLSAYLPQIDKIISQVSVNKPTPIFAAHGTDDTVVPFIAGMSAYHKLKDNGFNISWRTYAMGHSVCELEMNDLAGFINSLL